MPTEIKAEPTHPAKLARISSASVYLAPQPSDQVLLPIRAPLSPRAGSRGRSPAQSRINGLTFWATAWLFGQNAIVGQSPCRGGLRNCVAARFARWLPPAPTMVCYRFATKQSRLRRALTCDDYSAASIGIRRCLERWSRSYVLPARYGSAWLISIRRRHRPLPSRRDPKAEPMSSLPSNIGKNSPAPASRSTSA